VTGTDTDAGKTHVSCLLLRWLAGQGSAAGYKPVCSGGRGDAVALAAASSPPCPLDRVNPVWFQTPLAPLAASRIENRPVDFGALVGGFHLLASDYDHIVVEGAGGWESPLAEGKTVADLAAALGLPVLVVVNNKLGAVNHAILTVRSILARGLRCAGLVLNHPHDTRSPASIVNRSLLEEFLPATPILAEILHGETECDFSCLMAAQG
jgi:dethiobiotin synthetase